ncbi:MAG TPA: Hpt domain-containing protein [Candidatus Limnocylindrales bacterium]|nr:Hpt domain-containing protein [Candidatus Limnocylindrales bacterium]
MTGPIDDAVFASLVEMTGGEMDFVDELVDTYLEDGANQIATMRAAVESGDAEGLTRAAHSLKSGSLNVGALELGGLCRALEEAGRSGAIADPDARIAAIDDAFAAAGTTLLDERGRRTPG